MLYKMVPSGKQLRYSAASVVSCKFIGRRRDHEFCGIVMLMFLFYGGVNSWLGSFFSLLRSYSPVAWIILLFAEKQWLIGYRSALLNAAPATIRPATRKMKKGVHPQLQWISYVTQSGRLMNVMMAKIHNVGKVYHVRARRQMAQSIGQIARYKKRYQQKEEEENEGK
ncbi:hypothetical protein Vadar_015301 [Vaccinium darrowii]|uniref:Uncharacterized protein n=1 Tax=Vaccinium darrowii TaxID=229202 RepID=A0ACB7YM99_9ERIC|nr:hypothetical protein Vadar_015301 [Vaccinium darrowii]